MEHIKTFSEKTAEIQENPDFLTTQIITYLGNKRALIGEIEEEIRIILQTLDKEKLFCADIFSGSGIVARMNKKDFPKEKCAELRQEIQSRCEKELFSGIISQNYAPKNDHNIQKGERVFYTHENAVLIDTYRKLIDDIVENNLKKYFLAPLITEASIHVNTSGIFKGFYKDKNTKIGCFGGAAKNALSRIFGRIELEYMLYLHGLISVHPGLQITAYGFFLA